MHRRTEKINTFTVNEEMPSFTVIRTCHIINQEYQHINLYNYPTAVVTKLLFSRSFNREISKIKMSTADVSKNKDERRLGKNVKDSRKTGNQKTKIMHIFPSFI